MNNHSTATKVILTLLIITMQGLCADTSALAQKGRFEFDRAEFVSQHDIVFLRPIEQYNYMDWAFGAWAGNGDVGVLQWGGPEEVYFGINKADVWDRRYEEKKQEIIVNPDILMMLKERAPETFKTLMGESRNATQKNRFPTPKRCGGLVIRTPGSENYTKYQERMKLYTGQIKSEYETTVDKRSMDSFVYKDENLLVVKIKFDSDKPVEREFEIFRPSDEAKDPFENKLTGIEDAVGFVDGKDFGIEQHFPAHEKFPEDFHYVLRGRILLEIVSSYKYICLQASLWEAQTEAGRLFAASCNFDMEDPPAVALMDGIVKYITSDNFKPKTTISVEKALKPLLNKN